MRSFATAAISFFRNLAKPADVHTVAGS